MCQLINGEIRNIFSLIFYIISIKEVVGPGHIIVVNALDQSGRSTISVARRKKQGMNRSI